MNVRIAQPLGYSELGSRSNNEDCLYPDPRYASKEQKWFIVCDGVGGVERGEIASELAITSLDAYLRQHPIAVATDEFVQQAVAYIETQFNRYLSNHQEAVGMATTLTLVYFHEAGATVAHIGDSRVYHIRNGQVIWRTDDHSYVNELLKAGVLSPSEAHGHPQRNVITRALQGGSKPVEASVQLINHLLPGDYFFLCTDGILERISDELLVGTLSPSTQSNEQKLNTLRQYSLGNTRDNFTAYLIQIEHISGSVDPAYRVPPPVYEQHNEEGDADESVTLINVPIPQEFTPRPAETIAPPTSPSQQQEKRQPTSGQPNRTATSWLIPALVLAGALVGAGGYSFWKQYDTRAGKNNEPPKVITQSIPATRPASFSATPPTENSVDATEWEDLTVPASNATANGRSGGGKVETELPKPAKKPSADIDKPATKVNQRLDNGVSVMHDSKTDRMWLQRVNGRQIGDQYSFIGKFDKGIAHAEREGQKGYLNRDGRWLDEMKEPSNGKVAVRKGNRWGYLNMNGALSIDFFYDSAGQFGKDGTAEVVENGKTIRIDKQGHPKPING